MIPRLIIFTDLDGTLLDYHTYSFAAAAPALRLIEEQGIPLVLCSSKTRAEIERWRVKLNNAHPFIAENGGGIYIPPAYFPTKDLQSAWPRIESADGYAALLLGTTYTLLRETLEELRRDGFEIEGFGDMDAERVAEITGLSLEEAELARRRESGEPFVFLGEEARLEALEAAIREKGLHCMAGGRLFHLAGDNDKGEAVEILMDLYRKKFGPIVTLALGDSPNDRPMLERVDYPILVQNHRGEHDKRIAVPNLVKADGIGPQGWGTAVIAFIAFIRQAKARP
jgi:mannosyl-3-phosphoglycerate phosphatase family protein